MTTTMRPAYLADAKRGDTIRFDLPDPDADGGQRTYEGTLWAYERDNTHVPHPIIRFVLSGHVARGLFTCTPNLHVWIAATSG